MSVKNKLTRLIGKSGLKLRKAGPHIMFVVGVAGIIYTVVDSCIKARKLDETLNDELCDVDRAKRDLKMVEDDPKSTVEAIKDCKLALRRYRFAAIKKGCKVFLRPVLIGIASVILLGTSHAILTKTVISSSAALNAVTAEYKSYREAAKEVYGEEADKKLRFASLHKNDKEESARVIDPETGEETEETRLVSYPNPFGLGAYVMPFNKTYCGEFFVNDPYYDVKAIAGTEKWANEELDRKGFLFLDDIYKRMCYSITPISRTAGWYIEKGDNKAEVDPYVHITVESGYYNFGNGPEFTYLLDFNCAGDILRHVPMPKRHDKEATTI